MNNQLKGRLKSIFLIETTAQIIYEAYNTEPSPETKKACLDEAGQLHGIAERLKTAWANDPIPDVLEQSAAL